MSDPDIADELADIIRRWNEIEGRLKAAEQICGDAVVAAVNELRYAGRQFVDAMTIYVKSPQTEDDGREMRKHLQNVKYNLMNADHDCTDAVCLFYHERVKRMLNEYPLATILEYFPEFRQIHDQIDGANKVIAQSRETRVNRQQAYRALAEMHVPQLFAFSRKMEVSEPLMLESIQRTRIRFGLVLVGTVVLTAVFTACVMLFLFLRIHG
ncbi:hypothetical protein [Bradyrhizobium diazoefficiens]|uniref:Uncharacterized protein n=1 Tax=Bradyrhizobium diazoefficiens TaxID=1355477 RepID=A0A809WTP2_9BRAD|nr:hypothetical protein XF1B_05040 [Bradyrhizobium diazoefficiens]BCF22551.1 hypothetical protein XF14B_05030 [Bradyrhizobium diazoefficiens]